MLAVLEAAVNDQKYCDRFLFATGSLYLSYCYRQCMIRYEYSETCVPLYDIQDAGERIYGSGEVSWLDAYNEPQVSYLCPISRPEIIH